MTKTTIQKIELTSCSLTEVMDAMTELATIAGRHPTEINVELATWICAGNVAAVALIEETLTDGSTVFNIVLS